MHSNTPTQSKCPLCGQDGASSEVSRLGGYRISACATCSLRFAPEAVAQTTDYDDVHGTTEYQQHQVGRLRAVRGKLELVTGHATYRPFFQRVHPQLDHRLLDVGCGVGIFGSAARSLGWTVTGIDVSMRAVSMGCEQTGLCLRNATLQDLHREGERFDVITMFEVLEHLTTPLETLKAAAVLVRDHGSIFCTVPNWNCPEVQSATQRDWLPPIHVSFFTAKALLELGHRAGLEDCKVGVIRSDPWPPRLISKVGWALRRCQLRRRSSLGLWLHGRPSVNR